MALREKITERLARGTEGFTLIELLVALLLFSFLSLALLDSVRIGTVLWVRASAHADSNESSTYVHGLLRRLIENAYPLFLSADPSRRYVYFAGGKNSLTFLTDAPMALPNGGRARVTLSVEPDRDHVDLMLASNPELAAENDNTENARRSLLAGAAAIEFSYFGRTQSTEPRDWYDNWTDKIELPRLVRIHVQLPENDSRDWPDLVVAPRIRADVACIIDQLTMRCQGR